MPAGQADGAGARTFRRLVERNCLNLQPERRAAGVLERGAGEWAVGALLEEVGVISDERARPANEERVA